MSSRNPPPVNAPQVIGEVRRGDNTPGEFLSVYGGQILDLEPARLPATLRWQRIEAALKADKVLTVGQLQHYYGATGQDIARLAQVEHLIQPVHMRKTTVKVRFVALNKSDLTSRPPILGHLAATAEVRLSLGFEPSQWTTEIPAQDGEIGSQRPDALLVTQQGQRIAVEYDRGKYSKEKIKEKMLTFDRQFDGVIWAVPPPVRIKATNKASNFSRLQNVRKILTLTPELNHVRIHTLLTTVYWWHGSEVIED